MDPNTPDRIELRSDDGTMLGVLVIGGMRLEVKRGSRVFEIDLMGTKDARHPVVFERVLYMGDKEEAHENTSKQ